MSIHEPGGAFATPDPQKEPPLKGAAPALPGEETAPPGDTPRYQARSSRSGWWTVTDNGDPMFTHATRAHAVMIAVLLNRADREDVSEVVWEEVGGNWEALSPPSYLRRAPTQRCSTRVAAL